MEKRAIITAAGAITLTVLASSSALAVNFRGADNSSPGDVGTFTPKDTTTGAPQVATVYVDVPGTATAPSSPVAVTAAPSPAVTVSPAAGATRPVTTTQASTSGSDDGHKGEGEKSHSEDGGGHGDD